MRYLKQLDALRAIAVIFVIIKHYVPAHYIINATPNGIIGVGTFFVLSGYLITSILFHQRGQAEVPRMTLIKNFYGRRTLRIFPIYYLTVLLLLLFQNRTDTSIGTTYPYYLTYTANIYFFLSNKWDGMLSHLWSLSVEEQFYLLWPWAILFLPRKYLPHLLFGFIAVGIGTQSLLRGHRMGDVLPFTAFDSFGLGALLAWVQLYRSRYLPLFYRTASVAAALAAVLMALYVGWGVQLLPVRTIVSFMAVWLIAHLLLHEKDSPLRFVFNNRLLIFLGKISYGLYLYQNLIPKLITSDIVDKYINPLLPKAITNQWGLLFLFESLFLLVLVSWLSYEVIEKRFLKLKRYFGEGKIKAAPALEPQRSRYRFWKPKSNAGA